MRYEDRHKEEVIVILGCGPSLNKIDLKLLSNFTTIGTNRIPLLYDPDYLVFLDSVAVEKHRKVIEASKAIKFYSQKAKVPYVYHKFIQQLSGRDIEMLGKEFREGLYWSYSSIFPAISLAYVFGAKAIILLGVDLLRDDHFYSETKEKTNKKFNGVKEIINDFHRLNRFCEHTGFKIYNGNPESVIKDFEFIDFDKDFVQDMSLWYRLKNDLR